jgi:hypothetical protein
VYISTWRFFVISKKKGVRKTFQKMKTSSPNELIQNISNHFHNMSLPKYNVSNLILFKQTIWIQNIATISDPQNSVTAGCWGYWLSCNI